MNSIWKALLVSLVLATGAVPPVTRAQEPSTFKNEEIEQLVAPIALYPDSLIAQILMASTYPLEVVEAARWVKANPNVKDKALEDAMEKQTVGCEREVAYRVSAGAQHDERKARHDPEAGRCFPRAAEGGAGGGSAVALEGAGRGQPEEQQGADGHHRAGSAAQTVIKIEPAQPADGLRADLQPGHGLRAVALSGLSALLLLPAGLCGGAPRFSRSRRGVARRRRPVG